MSLPRHYAQRLTRRFAVNLDSAAAFSQADFDAWYAANPGKIKKNGSMYIIDGKAPGSTFVDVLWGSNGATALDHYEQPSIVANKTLKDFGKEIHIGTSSESSLLVFRLVQQSGPSILNGVPNDFTFLTSYVVVENDAADLPGNQYARFRVAVCRV